MIEIYSRTGCERCLLTKKKLLDADLDFVEYKIGEDVTRDSVVSLFPSVRSLPILTFDGNVVSLEDIIGK